MADRDPSPGRVPPTRPPKKKPAHSSAPPRVNLSVQDRRHKTRLLNETQRRKDQLLGLTTDDVAVHLHRYTVQPTAVMDDTREGCATAGKKAAAGPGSEGRATTVNFSTTTSASVSASAAAATSRVAESGTVEAAAASGGGAANSRWHAQYAQHMQHKKRATDLRSPLTSATGASAFPRLRDNGSGGEDEEEDEGDSDGEPLPLPPSNYEEWMAVGCPTGSWAALLQEEVYAPVAAERAMLTAKYDPKGRPLPPPPAATS